MFMYYVCGSNGGCGGSVQSLPHYTGLNFLFLMVGFWVMTKVMIMLYDLFSKTKGE